MPKTDIDRVLMNMGFSRNVAKTLGYFLTKKGKPRSVEIEKLTGLRQPEVSTAIKELTNRGWLTKREIKKKGKGRPIYEYYLATSRKEIVSFLVDGEKKKIDKIQNNINELKKLVK
jgi:predicted transcriptional regulator